MNLLLKVGLYNANMIARRKELGLTQKALAEMVGISVGIIGEIESLKDPECSVGRLRDVLTAISCVLDADADWLFPNDYLEALTAKRLPKRNRATPFSWIREVPLSRVLDSIPRQYLLTTPDEIDDRLDLQQLREVLGKQLGTLALRERRVIELRFGLIDGNKLTLHEVARKYGITNERVRQIEKKALTKLRHPLRSRKLKVFLG